MLLRPLYKPLDLGLDLADPSNVAPRHFGNRGLDYVWMALQSRNYLVECSLEMALSQAISY